MKTTDGIHSAYGPQLGDRLRLSHTKQNLVGLSGNRRACPFNTYTVDELTEILRSWRVWLRAACREARRFKRTTGPSGFLFFPAAVRVLGYQRDL
jgi:hypothetical protein